LADRPEGFEPPNAIGFIRLLPLSEIIATVLGVDSPSVQKVWAIYNLLVEKFGDEYAVLIDASREALSAIVDAEVADAIVRVRQRQVTVVPGFDGVYGRLVLSDSDSDKVQVPGTVQQRNLTDFM
jgi:PHP family Zn ribbon phosphoesterase